MEVNVKRELQPLGMLAVMRLSGSPKRAAAALRPLVGGLSREESVRIATYLRSGTIVLAIMEQTTDVLGSLFSVAGGSAIQTDGRFFWRADTADYVESYQIDLPATFLDFGRSRSWNSQPLSHSDLVAADQVLSDFYRASFDEALWPTDK